MKSILIAAMLFILPTVASSKDFSQVVEEFSQDVKNLSQSKGTATREDVSEELLKFNAQTLRHEIDYTKSLAGKIILSSKDIISGNCSQELNNNPYLGSAEKAEHVVNYNQSISDALSYREKSVKPSQNEVIAFADTQASNALKTLETDVYPQINKMKERGEDTYNYTLEQTEILKSTITQLRELRDEYLERESIYLVLLDESRKVFFRECTEPSLDHLTN